MERTPQVASEGTPDVQSLSPQRGPSSHCEHTPAFGRIDVAGVSLQIVADCGETPPAAAPSLGF